MSYDSEVTSKQHTIKYRYRGREAFDLKRYCNSLLYCSSIGIYSFFKKKKKKKMWTTHGLLTMYIVLVVSLTTLFVSLAGLRVELKIGSGDPANDHHFSFNGKRQKNIPAWAVRQNNPEVFIYLTTLLQAHPKGGLEDMVRGTTTPPPNNKRTLPPPPLPTEVSEFENDVSGSSSNSLPIQTAPKPTDSEKPMVQKSSTEGNPLPPLPKEELPKNIIRENQISQPLPEGKTITEINQIKHSDSAPLPPTTPPPVEAQ